MFRLLTILLGLLTTLSIFGQKHRFERISKKEGLSQSRVNVIAQDSLGFIWVGTDDGLNKLYARNIEVFRNQKDQGDQQLSGREISDILVWDNHRMIVSCRDGEVDLWDQKTGNISHISLPENVSPISLEKVGDQLWIGTNNGLYLANLKEQKAIPAAINQNYANWEIHDILFHRGFVFLAGYGYGVVVADINLSTAEEWVPKDKEGHILDQKMIKPQKLFVDSDYLYVGYDGAYLVKKELFSENFEWINAGTKVSFYGSKAKAILVTESGELWVGSNDGLYNYNKAKGDFEGNYWIENNDKSLSSDYVRYLFQDKAGSIWVGTSEQGLNVYHPSLNQFEHIHKNNGQYDALSSNLVFQMLEDYDGNIWMGSYGDGLLKMDKKGELTIFGKDSNQTHSNIISLVEWEHKIWFGSWGGGLNYYDLKTKAFGKPVTISEGLPSNTIISLCANDSILLVGTFKGLCSIDRSKKVKTISSDNKEVSIVDFPSNVIYNLAVKDKEFLIGTDGGGLIIYDPKTQHVKTIDKNSNPALSSNSVETIQVREEYVWVATTAGLDRFNLDFSEVKSWNYSNGLPSDFVYGFTFSDDENIWLSTNNGIYTFNPNLEEKGTAYLVEDGIQGNEFNQASVLKLRTGEILFGGTNGVSRFNPKSLIKNNFHSPVILNKVKLFGEELKTQNKPAFLKKIELNYNQNFLSFEFTGLNYVLPEKNKFQYKLEGLDQEWSEISDRNFVSYSDLKSGDYTLLVRMYNNDGVLSDKVLRLKITIYPPFWETWWFRVLSIILILFIVYGIYRWRLRSIEKEKQMLEEKVELRTQELKERTNELAEKNQDIMDSIEYAKKIQSAILPNEALLNEKWEEYFVFFLPKDVVSGDFYWFGESGDWKIITAADCTGHGVPGALMSMIGANLLHQIVQQKNITQPGAILTELNLGVQQALKQGTGAQETNDGMDISLCAFNQKEGKLLWAGAYNPLFLIRNGELTKFKANKYPIGGSHVELNRTYDTHELEVQKGDCIYMFSDGFPDQFGGAKMKKYMGKRFQNFLLDIHNHPMREQKQLILKEFHSWKGSLEQIDDVCIVGVRF